MDPVVEDPLPRKGIALETKATVPTVNPKMTNPTVVADEPEVRIVDLSMEPTQPSFFFTIAQGNYHPR